MAFSGTVFERHYGKGEIVVNATEDIDDTLGGCLPIFASVQANIMNGTYIQTGDAIMLQCGSKVTGGFSITDQNSGVGAVISGLISGKAGTNASGNLTLRGSYSGDPPAQ